MNYTPSMEVFVRVLEKSKNSPDISRIVVGISTYNQSLGSALKKARFALDWGFGGICFFSYNDLSEKSYSLDRIRTFLKEDGP